ncbi:ABC transporter substrate-binding protein [Acidovorax lacteus]|uniref:ABC transporter substrate-binding protein n=2 Tax=Acidovorax lacteus TaxID=1924988 RepID=A0ABP8L9K1_9BURK
MPFQRPPSYRSTEHSLPSQQALVSRRRVLTAGAALPLWAAGRAIAQDAPLRIGQSIALTGPLADLGTAMHLGAKAAFAALNARAGVYGRPIELVTLDDAYEVPKAVANVDRLMADKDIFALFNCMGTPMIAAMLPKVLDSGLPFFAPFTGALVSRVPNARNVFNIRASYPDEAEKIVQHLDTIGTRRIGIVYQNNAFGKEVFTAAQQLMARLKLPEATTATVESDASDAAAAASRLASADPEAVIVGLAGKPTLDFVRAFRAQRRGVTLYALSVMGTQATVKALGADATGMAISQVVPLPTNAVTPVVREFQQAWKALGTNVEASHLALEGYINARVFAEALQRAGRNPSRSAFIDATWSLRKWDLGGFEIQATTPERNASRFVELTLVGREGRFLR